MKKLLIIAILMFNGCGFFYDNCVLKYKTVLGHSLYVRYECFEGIYDKKDCMDKEYKNAEYYDYVTESCSDFCANKQDAARCNSY